VTIATLIGAAAADQLFEGSGADQFIYRFLSDTGSDFGFMDIIRDFSAASGEAAIQISGLHTIDAACLFFSRRRTARRTG
jgi:Ca2+-binding RTX toxin-like protein